MTRALFALSIVSAVLFCQMPVAMAQEAQSPHPPAMKIVPGAEHMVPHRAVYKLTLDSTRNGSRVVDASGKMYYEWKDACDAWTMEQRFQLHFVYSQADESDSQINYATWESKDGLSYRFTMRKSTNGTPEEDTRGAATLEPNGGPGVAKYEGGKTADVKLASGTMFPTAHTITLLEHAVAGDQLFNKHVFDGTDDDAVSEVNAVIGGKTEIKSPSFDKTKILTGPAWSVRLAFFPSKSQESVPDYEMTMTLLRNGIAESMLIDYGDFVMKGTLEDIERVPDPGC